MEIDIKYKCNQEVWVMDNNKPIKIQANSFKVECFYDGYSAVNWGETRNEDSGGYPIKISYNRDSYGKGIWYNQKEVFATKEELLKSL